MNHTFNIAGGCVSRDIFNFCDKDCKKYNILQYNLIFSPLFILDSGCNIDEQSFKDSKVKFKEILNNASDFLMKCNYIDITHSFFNYIEKTSSDFFIIDSSFAKMNYFVLENDSIVIDYYSEYINFLINSNIIPPIKKYLYFDQLDDSILNFKIEIFCKKLLTYYNIKQIILLEINPANLYIDDEHLYNFDPKLVMEEKTKRNKVFSFLKKHLLGCHIIYSPDFLFANIAHIWGKSPFHYTIDAYQYYMDCIDAIVNDGIIGNFDYIKTMLLIRQKKYFELLYYSLSGKLEIDK